MNNKANGSRPIKDGEASDSRLHMETAIKNLFGDPKECVPARLKNSLHDAIMLAVEQPNFDQQQVRDLGELYHLINSLEGVEECYWWPEDNKKSLNLSTP